MSQTAGTVVRTRWLAGIDLSMAQWAMLKLEVVELALEGLVFASLAGVVFLGEYGLSAGNAGAEVTTALTTVDITRER